MYPCSRFPTAAGYPPAGPTAGKASPIFHLKAPPWWAGWRAGLCGWGGRTGGAPLAARWAYSETSGRQAAPAGAQAVPASVTDARYRWDRTRIAVDAARSLRGLRRAAYGLVWSPVWLHDNSPPLAFGFRPADRARPVCQLFCARPLRCWVRHRAVLFREAAHNRASMAGRPGPRLGPAVLFAGRYAAAYVPLRFVLL